MAFLVGQLQRKSAGSINRDVIADRNEYRLYIFVCPQRSPVDLAVYDDIRAASGFVFGLSIVGLFVDAEIRLSIPIVGLFR